jgi:pSer/pThr/pTyr-binding forkhead associated (FHA) protein
MQVILKPLSHPELGDVVIAEQLFPIGRGEDPFASYDQNVVAHLSRRHARIFREDQGIYVADLGSRNGTRLNGKPVEFKPFRLLAGDRLSFAGHLDYEVEIRAEIGDTQAGDASSPGLTLLPAEDGSPLEALAITRFPYLIGKSDPAFSGSGGGGVDRGGYLSRRHAHIFSRGGRLFIEDLASTNGTCLNGERLDEHAHPLADGDVLQFGGGYFSYRVQLQASPQGSPESGANGIGEAPVNGVADDECHTTFVTSADSFLDIFCVEMEEEEAVTDPEVEVSDAVENSESAGKGPKRPGLLRKFRTFSGELSAAFRGEERRRSSRAGWITLAVLTLVGAVALGINYSGKNRRDVENLLAQERYREAAELASAQLGANPGQEVIAELATEALTKHVLDRWLELVERGDYVGAQSLLVGVRPLASNIPTADELLDMLGWVTELQQFIAVRGGPEAPVRMYEQEETIEALLTWWIRDPEEYRSRMGLLLNYVPEFKEAHALAFSQLRSLRYEKSVYLTAIEKLDTIVGQKLALDQPADLVAEIERFARQYPRLGGLERLQTDLQNYLVVQAALDQGDRLRAAVLIENSEFSTPPFVAKAASLQATLLPTEAVARLFSEASEAWRAGELARALELLAEVADQRGGELAAQKLDSKRRIIAEYTTLQQFRGDPDYGERLVRFYSALDPVEDGHFTRALEQEFQRHSVAARKRADSAWDRALESWSRYRNGGGIRGLLRLEEQVSPRFGEQAGLLSEAHSNANYARQVYELLRVQYSEQRAELYQQIGAEMNLQRRSLQQLSMVLSPEVLDTKLAMLAAVPADTQARLN